MIVYVDQGDPRTINGQEFLDGNGSLMDDHQAGVNKSLSPTSGTGPRGSNRTISPPKARPRLAAGAGRFLVRLREAG